MTSYFVLYREVVLHLEVKIITNIIQKGSQSVSFIERVSDFRRLKCASIAEKEPQSASL